MTVRGGAVAFLLYCACASRVASPPPPPIEQGIVGAWDAVCQVDGREVTECTGKDGSSGFMEFSADGTWRADGGHGFRQ
jgi:hypothetical protein